ncbi:saccharopine dehydrogenase NADP-binding domain-containing protein, partial [Priestia megaterium]|uniref:saccharopine dehydrogenase NADP-binding domain-containing protein n=1 Tax=Priestia megaterium TaxID=1404 RepID=UPI0035B69067
AAQSGPKARAAFVDLRDPDGLACALAGAGVVINASGPFFELGVPVLEAAISAGAHYLDITAEINVYRQAEALGDAEASVGTMLLPGVGWDVVPTDCLAA